MYFVDQSGSLLDDGHGLETAPAYALSPDGSRVELAHEEAQQLTARFYAEHKSRLPIGDFVAAVAKSFGIASCPPCQRRQAALNRWGNTIASPFRR